MRGAEAGELGTKLSWRKGSSTGLYTERIASDLMSEMTVKLGPLSTKFFFLRPWTDAYPACQEWEDEFGRLLAFAEAQGQFSNYLPRLRTPRNNQRDEALNELRVAFFLHRSGFPIVAWEPPGQGGKVGEYTIQAQEGGKIFTEVKSRGWESELTQAERLAGRAKLPKYIDGDGGEFATWQGLRDCIAAAYAKFRSDEQNLLVIADDFFVSLTDLPLFVDVALFDKGTGYGGEAGYFTAAAYENLGGLAVFAATVKDGMVQYKFHVYENPFALPQTKLPASLAALSA